MSAPSLKSLSARVKRLEGLLQTLLDKDPMYTAINGTPYQVPGMGTIRMFSPGSDPMPEHLMDPYLRSNK